MDVSGRLASFLRRHQVRAFLVGGSVRDAVLGRPVRDIDIAVQGRAAEWARAFADEEGGAFYLMDAEHDVARVILSGLYVDWAKLRGDVVSDMGTRDFTLNAMARPIEDERSFTAGLEMGRESEIIDPYHGLDDLRQRQVRVVSDASFQDDAVRLLRAPRLAGELGLTIEPITELLMRRDAHLLAAAPMERVRDELFKIIALPDPAPRLVYLDTLGLLEHVLPELVGLKGVAQSEPHAYDAFEHSWRTLAETVDIERNGYRDAANDRFTDEVQAHCAQVISADRSRALLLRLVALLHDIGKATTRSVDAEGRVHFYDHETVGAELIVRAFTRLRLSNDEIALARAVVEHHLRPAQLAREGVVSRRAAYRFFRDAGAAGIEVCVLSVADLRARSPLLHEGDEDSKLRSTNERLLDLYLNARATVIAPVPLVNGRTLMRELNLLPGPELGRLLEAIREAQVEDKVRSEKEALVLAQALLEEWRHAPKRPRE